jgi:hypothetical protein
VSSYPARPIGVATGVKDYPARLTKDPSSDLPVLEAEADRSEIFIR